MVPQVPHSTTPFAKLIRTGEGVMVYAFGLILVLVPIVTSNLPPALATSLNTGKWVAIVTMVSRTGLKVVGAIKNYPVPLLASGSGQLGAIAPEPAPLPELTEAEIDEAMRSISSYVAGTQAFQAQPGTPADQITAAGAPDPLPAASAHAVTPVSA